MSKATDFTQSDLIDRGWNNELIKEFIFLPDKIIHDKKNGHESLYNKKKIRELESTYRFFYIKYRSDITTLIQKSSVKKVNKDDLRRLEIDVQGSRASQKRKVVFKFYQAAKEYDKEIEPEFIFNFNLEDMLRIIRENSFKEHIGNDLFEKMKLEKELKVFADSLGLNFNNLKQKLQSNPTSQRLEEIKEEVYREKREKEKKLREITSVEDIENFYFDARSIKREFIAFLGPTNSGKTYQALQELEKAETGVYLAPLRLLAREVYDSFIEKGIKTSLITGEEKIIDENATHICSTIEALDIYKKFDVAVIDEVQFVNDSQRGQAWTRAVYGVFANTVICLGSSNSEEILKKILRKTKENIKVTHLERKTPLRDGGVIYNIEDLKQGDAVIAFSRKAIYDIKAQIEARTDLRVGLIYGMLPPEIRVGTAKKFNNGEVDIVIATDAIGIGLNLDIQRIVYSDFNKYNGFDFENITEDLFKQISGRAGRYMKHEEGLVSVCEPLFYKFDRKEWNNYIYSLHEESKEIENIYFFPEYEHLLKVAEELNEDKDLKFIINTYQKYFSDKDKIFKKNFSFIDDNLEAVNHRELDLYEKYRLLFAPVNKANYDMFIELLDSLEENKRVDFDTFNFDTNVNIAELEELIANINICRWMHYLFPAVFELGELDKVYEYALINLERKMDDLSRTKALKG